MRRLLLSALLLASTPAFANKLCVVDFQAAISQTNEGKSAQRKLDSMTTSKRAELERQQASLQAEFKKFEKEGPVLTEERKRERMQELMVKEQQLQQAAATAESEMQQTYYNLLGGLDTKLRDIVRTVGEQNACSVVLDSAAVVFKQSAVVDVTNTLVTKYNQQYP